jgi:hypothetical protein
MRDVTTSTVQRISGNALPALEKIAPPFTLLQRRETVP